MKITIPKIWKYLLSLLVGGFILFFFAVPLPDFERYSYATVLKAKDGRLLGARIAKDGQWRFPPLAKTPLKFEKAILHFEDEYFYRHPGINPVSMWKALVTNIKEGEIKRGGSTLSMQVIRLSRKNKSRTIIEKLLEMGMALRMEMAFSKEEILALYSSHAPFGGNVVGLSAAAWRYYGRPPETLSWAEAATLAVLPNSPSLIYPGKNSDILRKKRNRLLNKLALKGIISEETAMLSKAEPLPGEPLPLPNHAPHLLTRTIQEGQRGQNILTTINYKLQEYVSERVQRHHLRLKGNYIHNAAALVVEIETGNALAYVGNVATEGENGQYVDMITAQRSTGSLLKPILYAAAVDDGLILPQQLLSDVPVFLQGFAPQNFDKKFHGTVPADKALMRSYNVPFVHLLKAYGYEKFHQELKTLGMKSLDKPAGYYGLSMILGGAESSLWEVSAVYAGMARSLLQFFKRPLGNQYSLHDYHPNHYTAFGEKVDEELYSKGIIDAAAISYMLQAMQELNRPEEQSGWKQYSSSRSIAWKTGTSYGFKDAWAVGLNTKYVVAVWVGNADGEGRPELVGVKAAAPLLFEIFEKLKVDDPLPVPLGNQKPLEVCAISGFKAGPHCTDTEVKDLPEASKRAETCPFHKLLHLDETQSHQVSSACYPVHKMKQKSWFVLPPAEAWYYKQYNASYTEPPEFLAACLEKSDKSEYMQLIYPREYTRVYVPTELDGTAGSAIFEVAHRNPSAILYWHLDEQYIGNTAQKHQMAINPDQGNHKLHLIDNQGRELTLNFEVISKRK